jgi:hypothetical protein
LITEALAEAISITEASALVITVLYRRIPFLLSAT